MTQIISQILKDAVVYGIEKDRPFSSEWFETVTLAINRLAARPSEVEESRVTFLKEQRNAPKEKAKNDEYSRVCPTCGEGYNVPMCDLCHVATVAGQPSGVGESQLELISAKVHEQWMENKLKIYCTSRKSETGEELMVPYEQLSEAAKELDRGSVRAVLAAQAVLARKVGEGLREAAIYETTDVIWKRLYKFSTGQDFPAGEIVSPGQQGIIAQEIRKLLAALAAPAPKPRTDHCTISDADYDCTVEQCPDCPKPAPPAKPTDRQFAYRFLKMPNHEQWAIARQYGATSEKDADLPDSELFVVWIKRLRERGKLDEFKAEIVRRAAERKP